MSRLGRTAAVRTAPGVGLCAPLPSAAEQHSRGTGDRRHGFTDVHPAREPGCAGWRLICMVVHRMTLARLIAFGGALGTVGFGVVPVQALSCAVHPDGSPEAILAGTEQLATGDSFFERYDLAVTGTVTAVHTDDAPGSPTYGDTLVSVDVLNAFGVSDIVRSIVIFQDDPGWMSGYPFEQGNVYFIPLQVNGPNGEANYSFLCDPITPTNPSAAALLPAQAISSIPVAYPEGVDDVDATTEPSPSPPTTGVDTVDDTAVVAPSRSETAPPETSSGSKSGSADWVITAVALLVTAGALSMVFAERQRRIRVARSPA